MNKRTPAGEALTELILETFRLNGELLDAGNRITKPHGLTSARWQVMGAIGEEAGPSLTVAQIARRMGLARQGVQRIVNDLKALGMVELTENIDHVRAKLVTLTPKGITALEAVSGEQTAWVNVLAEDISERRLVQAVKVLQTIVERSEALETAINDESSNKNKGQ